MNYKNVKLIVTDMDGTLLNSKEEVSSLFLEQFQKLKNLGIHFIAASGRQYNSIASKLHAIKEDITIIGENGSIAKRQDELLVLQTMDSQAIENIIPILRDIPDVFIILCGEDSAYIESNDPELINMFKEYYSAHEIVADLTEVAQNTPILKIALYHAVSSEEKIYPYLKNVNSDFLLKISGQHWLDISIPSSNKGVALKIVQEKMQIKPEETMVFGDYLNDLEMLKEAHFSYAMKNAHPEVVKAANYRTESNNELGVEKIIQQVIESHKV